MSEYGTVKRGHPILGFVLGVLGIIVGLALTLVAGWAAGALAILLGLIALLIGVVGKAKGGKGIAAIIAGVLAIVIAVALSIGSSAFVKAMHDEAVKLGTAPMMEKYTENTGLGFLGITLAASNDKVDMKQFEAELTAIRDHLDEINKKK